ncbi:hypothetical protein [Clostridium estertheticum]|uniref:Guanylate cyclase domain-containing protein n=1 Tax=Clostridium estertheticum TaxID=238834 RepID=A0A7Y3T126_9CLOT|nr:hypothetical protein [Clostridium estertheticum]NNU78753.1 hypothetical protein [Clostridium estertheticum]WBL49695.1 hypothetical protein LOR37_23525 [Clostridium estertheticum]
MTVINNKELKKVVLDKFNLAYQNSNNILEMAEFYDQNISNNIPSYDINEMEFATYDEDKFVCLFADMRGSTSICYSKNS